MKKIILLSLSLINVTYFYSQSAPDYVGDESKCPYLHPEKTAKPAMNSAITIDDFESHETSFKKWSNSMESGSIRSSIEICETAQAGTSGAKISFIGSPSKGSWTNLQCKATIPDTKTKITFWAKAPLPCTIKISLYQGTNHNELEIFGKKINIGTEWTKYETSISEITEVIFSHPQQDGGTASKEINKAKVNAIGFCESGKASEFFIDNLNIE